jgi:hypothetical protein
MSWTREETAEMKILVDELIAQKDPHPFITASARLDGRTARTVYSKHLSMQAPVKGKWSKEEDLQLLAAVAQHGEVWKKVQMHVPTRNASQCRDHYKETLDPNIKRGTFSQEEVEKLRELVATHGAGNWARIAAELPGRTDSMVSYLT